MRTLRDAIVDLYRQAATSLPRDVEKALRKAYRRETQGSNARAALATILENVRIAREDSKPICQDTGVPVFFVSIPSGISHLQVREDIIRATRIATRQIPLRPNAVDIMSEKNSGDNTGAGFPVMYLEETKDTLFVMNLMLKGAGSENIGQIYKLPSEDIMAERNLEGVRKCILDAVYKAQGRGCPPYVIGAGIGAAKDQVAKLSKVQLLRDIEDKNIHRVLRKLEQRILEDLNCLGIGPIGFGGATTAIGVKIGVCHRHPATYFVDVAMSCWADRKAQLVWDVRKPQFEIRK